MADLQKVAAVYTQFAYEEPGKLKVAEVFVQFAYEEPGKLKVAEVFVQFAYEESSATEYDDGTPSGGIVFGGQVVEVGSSAYTDPSATGGIVMGGESTSEIEPDENHQVDGACTGGIVFGGTIDEQWQAEPNNLVAVKGGTYRISGELYTKTETLSYPGIGSIAALVNCGEPPATSGYYRYDLLSIDTAGIITVTAGTEATTPVMPATPDGEVKLDHVLRYYGQTNIIQADIGKTWTTPQIVSLTATVADDELSWAETSTTIKIYCYDQYGMIYTGSRTVTAAITTGNGTLTPASKSGSGTYFTFTYTRGGTVSDVSPFLTFTNSATGAFVTANITLLDSGGNPMF